MRYDCIKPDSAVMKVSKNLGIVNKESGDINFTKTVRTIQEYSIERNLRPAVLDLYFLIEGRQTDANKYEEE
jgi:hypothetical protein